MLEMNPGLSCGGIGITIERTDIGTVLYRSNTAPLYRPAKTAAAYPGQQGGNRKRCHCAMLDPHLGSS